MPIFNFFIREVAATDLSLLEEGFLGMGWGPKPTGYFSKCLAQHQQGDCCMLVACPEEGCSLGDYLGHLKIVWRPEYEPLSLAGIPEIQDVNIVPAARRKGVASGLMDRAEGIIRQRCLQAGIGVGLHPGYNAAMRMYVLRGYVPDGYGLTYRNQGVSEGQEVTLDDDLILHLVKDLASL